MTYKEEDLNVGNNVIIKVRRDSFNSNYNYIINIETNDSSMSILLDSIDDLIKIIKFLIEFVEE